MNLNSLSSALIKSQAKVFISLCRTRSFTVTSRQLGISQSTVSRIITELENDLAVELFDHGVRPIRLTAEGAMLQKFLTKELMVFDQWLQGLQEHNAIKTPLRIGLVESISCPIGRHIIRNIKNCSPVTVLTGTANYLLRLLDEDLLDVIICSDPFINRNDLKRRFLFREPSIILHPESMKLPEKPTWKDLQFCGLPLIHYHKNNSGGRLEKKLFNQLGISFVSCIEVDINAMLMSFIADGLGWGLMRPTTFVQHPNLLKGIKVSPVPEPVVSRELYVITRNGEFDQLAARITEVAASCIETEIAPRLLENAPWVADYLFVAADGTGRKKALYKGIESNVIVL